MKRSGSDIHLWVLRYEDVSWQKIEPYMPLLSDAEVLVAQHYIYENEKVSFLLSHLLQKVMIRTYCPVGSQMESLVLERALSGKPYVSGGGAAFFNLSRTNQIAACAMSDAFEVGVDVESFNQELEVDLFEQLLTLQEQEEIGRLDKGVQIKALLRIWTKKEALAKADGRGIAMGFDQVNRLSENWAYHQEDILDKGSLCLAWPIDKEGIKVQRRDFDLTDFINLLNTQKGKVTNYKDLSVSL